MSPPPNYETALWWCGDNKNETPCQTASKALGTLQGLTGGSILGVASMPSSTSTATSSIASIPSSPPKPTSTLPLSVITTTAQPASCTPETNWTLALGAGIGVPLGIAIIGFISFLVWKESRMRKNRPRPRTTTKMLPQDILVSRGLTSEMADSEVRRELDHGSCKTELCAAHDRSTLAR